MADCQIIAPGLSIWIQVMGKSQKDFARWKLARNPSPRPTIFSLFSVNSRASYTSKFAFSLSLRLFRRLQVLITVGRFYGKRALCPLSMLAGTGRYRAIASSVYATVFFCSCYSDYVPNSSALQISKNLYQVYINSQSYIHNGLQGRDGKAIVTYNWGRKGTICRGSSLSFEDTQFSIQRVQSLKLTQIVGFDDDTWVLAVTDPTVPYPGLFYAFPCASCSVLEAVYIRNLSTRPFGGDAFPGINSVTAMKHSSMNAESHSPSQRESRKKGIGKILRKDHIMSKTTRLGMTRTLHEPTYGREGLLVA
ncbi:hypothetical protein F5146DRAFT_1000215 [Armillaria mellea]|nr:hypothetical protein F5146DRAFT_1000215 [Armillaria mellea]